VTLTPAQIEATLALMTTLSPLTRAGLRAQCRRADPEALRAVAYWAGRFGLLDEYADADLSDQDLEEMRLDSPVEWTS